MAVTAKANAERIRAASALRRCPSRRDCPQNKRSSAACRTRYPAQGKKVASELPFVLIYVQICKGNARDLIRNRCSCPQGIGLQNVTVFHKTIPFLPKCMRRSADSQGCARDSPRWRTNSARIYRRLCRTGFRSGAPHAGTVLRPLRWPRTQTPERTCAAPKRPAASIPFILIGITSPHTFSIRGNALPEKEFYFQNSE